MALIGKIFLFTGIVFFCVAAKERQMPLPHTLGQLNPLNLEQMQDLVRGKWRKCQKISSDTVYHGCLADALKIVLGRADQKDEIRYGLFLFINYQISVNKRSSIHMNIAKEALLKIKSSRVALEQRATYLEILNNLMAEKSNDRKLLMHIKKSKLKVPKDVVKFRWESHHLKSPSPSRTALMILGKKRSKK